MRPNHFWIFLLLFVAGLVIVFVPSAVLNALAPAYTLVDLKSLGHFPLDQSNSSDADIPARWRKLNGCRVALEGFMFDAHAQSSTRNFQFVYEIANEHGGPPYVQERVFASVPHGTVPFSTDLVEVDGVLHVGVSNPTGNLVESVFRLDVDQVRPLASDSGTLYISPAIPIFILDAVGDDGEPGSRRR